MNTYEKHIHTEITEWKEERRGYLAEVANNVVLTAFSCTASYIPPGLINAVTEAVEVALRSCFSASLYTTSKTQIVKQANKIFGCNAKSISDLKHLELEQLDLLSSSYCTSSEVMAILEGAGAGLGGLVFIATDIPALIMINIRALIQLAFIYGIDATHPDECEYILTIMTLAAADGRERIEILDHLDTLARANAQKTMLVKQLQDHLVGEAMTRMVHVAHKIAVRLTHAKLLQMIPIVGSAVGAGANYLYTKEMMTFGLMVFRKRWLTVKFKLPPDNLAALSFKSTPESLSTSWVVMPNTGDEFDDELEEDFSERDSSKGGVNM